MLFSKKTLLALAVSAAAGAPLAMANQSESNGFIEDSSLNFLTRNYYFNQDKTSGNKDIRAWGQSFQLAYSSGYTQGTVGFGIDASAYTAVKLDGGRGHAPGSNMFPLHTDGDAVGNSSSFGAAVKARVSNTELRYGNNLRPYNPVFAPAEPRLVPSTVTGFWLTSAEVTGLDLEAGHFTASKDFNSTNHSDNFRAAYADVYTDRVDFIGGSYAFSDNLSTTLYAAQFEDIWRSYYANTNYTYGISDDQSLNLDFNIYRTNDTGKKKAGEIGVTAWSLAAAYTLGAHTVTLAHQQINGDTPFDYLGMKGTYHDSIFLANASMIADFNGPGERSWGLFYDLDFAAYGVPGLSLNARYVKGTGVDGGTKITNSKYAYYGANEDHWERDVTLSYTVQEGTAKDLSVRLRHGTHKIGTGKSDTSSDQFRVIIEYPYEIF